MLALLLVRAGVPTTVVEMHQDFDRDFRGDTIHPSTMEVLHQIGLADRVLSLPHTKAPSFRIMSSGRSREVAVYRRLPTQFSVYDGDASGALSPVFSPTKPADIPISGW
jgi:2-polyprenyl-6-methoxyphenol hydroxylase-like FAD-dependent oxidoreductase